MIESFKVIEEKRKEINHLENEKNGIIFEKEKLNLKLQDLGIQLNQIGRSTKEFDNSSDTPSMSFSQLSEAERRMFKLRTDLASIGDIDPLVIKEAKETEERYQFLSHQSVDLEKASADLKILIKDLEAKIRFDFQEALKLINKEFENYFRLMFGGGKAKLKFKTQNLKPKTDDLNDEGDKNPEEAGDLAGIETPTEEAGLPAGQAGIEIDLNLPKGEFPA